MLNVLFICSQNKLRSPTAEQIFADEPGVICSSAGLNHDAENPLTAELLGWADLVFVMENVHRQKLQQRFRGKLGRARVICLDIPDDYAYMAPELIALLHSRVRPHLQSVRRTPPKAGRAGQGGLAGTRPKLRLRDSTDDDGDPA